MNFPSGTVILWTDAPENIPDGWVKYTAAEGRFIRGVPDGGAVESTGGASSHNHNAGAIANDGAHGHAAKSYTFNTVGASSYLLSGTPAISSIGTHNHTASLTLSDGVGEHTHTKANAETGMANHLPPHKRGIYIVKT